jgi:hypothetical protein
LQKHYKNNHQVIFSFKRTASVPGFIIIAPEYEKALVLVEKIGLLKQGFEGAYEGP